MIKLYFINLLCTAFCDKPVVSFNVNRVVLASCYNLKMMRIVDISAYMG